MLLYSFCAPLEPVVPPLLGPPPLKKQTSCTVAGGLSCKQIVNLFNVSRSDGGTDNVVNISMDSGSVLSNDSTATSGSSTQFSRREQKKKEKYRMIHLV